VRSRHGPRRRDVVDGRSHGGRGPAIVPESLRSAALALRAPEWRTTLRVVLPTARAGLVTGGILGVARAVGETAPVRFGAGDGLLTLHV